MGETDISSYIICRENCSLRYLEALALNGFIKRFDIIDCDRKRFQKIRAYLIDGSVVESECRFDEEVRVSVRIIAGYIGLYRNKMIEKELRIAQSSKQKEE
ncbi:MAG: hypothetical protein J7K21_01420 [Desulfurococcales archaeon]|nr:hypothetical protein [Desulfurococcales archaeon]